MDVLQSIQPTPVQGSDGCCLADICYHGGPIYCRQLHIKTNTTEGRWYAARLEATTCDFIELCEMANSWHVELAMNVAVIADTAFTQLHPVFTCKLLPKTEVNTCWLLQLGMVLCLAV